MVMPMRSASKRQWLLSSILLAANSVIAFSVASPQSRPGLERIDNWALKKRVYSDPGSAPAQYRNPPQAPPLFNDTAESILRQTEILINGTRTLLDELVANITPQNATFRNTMLPQLVQEEVWTLYSSILTFYAYVSSDPALRDVSTEVDGKMSSFFIDVGSREDVFHLVEAIYKNQNTSSEELNPESVKALEVEYKGYIASGLGIPAGPQRDRFKALQNRLSELSISFSTNLNSEKGGIWYTPEELVGVPADVVGGLEKGTGANEGKVRVTFKSPVYSPTMQYAQNSTTRKTTWLGYENRVLPNIPIMKEAIVLRDEAARLLGYDNHAAFRLEGRMAKNTETVNAFLGDLRKRLAPKGALEMKHLLEVKKKDLESRNVSAQYDGNYYYWDNPFYDRMMKEQEYSIDNFKISEYFPLQSTIEGMLAIFEELFGMAFVEITPEERTRLSPSGNGTHLTWHEDVKMFTAWDTVNTSPDNGFLGYLYLDLHPRDGKYNHAANFNIQPGFLKKDGSCGRHYPATSLVCNLSKPTATRPSLLLHSEVVTLFHELGHGIHDLSGRTRYSRFHGTRTARDFVEAPSQMLENWCWTASQLKSLSSHYQTGESIPDDLIEKLVSTKNVNLALSNLRQLHFGLFDMAIHTPKTHADAEAIDISDLYNELRDEVSGLKGIQAPDGNNTWGNGAGTFGHLMGGYDAGYYGYLWSQVYSTDMFYSAFKANPMNGVEGRRYRQTVLQKGGSQDELKTLMDFLGRAPSTEAFYQELGVNEALRRLLMG